MSCCALKTVLNCSTWHTWMYKVTLHHYKKGEWQVRGGGCMMNRSDLFASSQSDKHWDLSPCLFTIDAVAFQSASAPAHKLNPRDFPFQRAKKGDNITSFRVTREAWVEGLVSFTLSNISWFRFHGKSGCLCCHEQRRAGNLSGSGRSWLASIFHGRCF